MQTKQDSWIRTFSGGQVFFFEPERSNIEFKDISHGLSLLCRFNGATKSFYSVAQHSVIVAENVYKETKNKSLAYTALMHDAAEAFISDVPSPFKKFFQDFSECEKRMEIWLAQRFGFGFPFGDLIKKHDLTALSTEMRDLMLVQDNSHLPKPYSKKIHPLGPEASETLFNLKAYELMPAEQLLAIDSNRKLTL